MSNNAHVQEQMLFDIKVEKCNVHDSDLMAKVNVL